MSRKRKKNTVVQPKPSKSISNSEPTEAEVDAEIKKSKLSFFDAREKLRNGS